jgi:preprotein translocase subunit SecD
MMFFALWKKALIAIVLFVGCMATLPNFFAGVDDAVKAQQLIAEYEKGGQQPPAALVQRAGQWPSWMPSSTLNLGLDLQGGAHFLLEVQVDAVISQRLKRLDAAIGPALREAGIRRYRKRGTGDDFARVRITIADDLEKAEAALIGLAEPLGDNILGVIENDLEIVAEENQVFRLQLTEAARDSIVNTTVQAAIEVIRTRVDALGTREPTIVRQGRNRILLQLPGVNNVNIDEITKPAKLEFRMVNEDANPNNPPRGVDVFPYDPELNPDLEGQLLAVESKVSLTGDNLAEATQGFNQYGAVGVNIRFDASGAKIFGVLSRDNIGQRFAMILDGQVLSAPVFREYIPNGGAIITGQFSVESAIALAVNLASGSLPTSVTVEESSFVGPELGADSIEAGKWAAVIGFGFVLVYMFLSYGQFGLMANIALLLNVMLIFGALSIFGATLTLPGVAGIVLTIGMAVDANVLVFERIREELKRGRNVVRAIETGYSQALTAIIDANLTTFIAALVLFSMGAGPVRGFAVTLGIGIVTSVFTAVMLTRFFIATWYDIRRPKVLVL